VATCRAAIARIAAARFGRHLGLSGGRRCTRRLHDFHQGGELVEGEELLQRGAASTGDRRPGADQPLHQERRRDRADDEPERREKPAEQASERRGINLPRDQIVATARLSA